MTEFDYQQISVALDRLAIPVDASECQGAISAVVCMTGTEGMDTWLGAHLPEVGAGAAQGDALARETRQLISDLYVHVHQQLNSGEFSYELLMPEDSTGLELRTQALSHWCQGFMLGLRYAGVTDISKFSGELAEILQDIVEISQVSGNGLENTEEEEQSYTELVEYLRVGVMLFFETLQNQHNGLQTTTVH